MKAPMFEVSEIADLMRALQVKGTKIFWRASPRLKAGGTWVAQISRDGCYLRVCNTDAIKAIRELADRFKHHPSPMVVQLDGSSAVGGPWRKWARVWEPNAEGEEGENPFS